MHLSSISATLAYPYRFYPQVHRSEQEIQPFYSQALHAALPTPLQFHDVVEKIIPITKDSDKTTTAFYIMIITFKLIAYILLFLTTFCNADSRTHLPSHNTAFSAFHLSDLSR